VHPRVLLQDQHGDDRQADGDADELDLLGIENFK
jgi:hypothetical protein